MARFRYRMQNILEIKLKLEDQAKMDYAAANMKLNEEREMLHLLSERRRQYEAVARALIEDRLRVREIRDNQTAIETMKEKIADQIVAVRIAEKNVENARRVLQEMMQDRKTHEKLKERAFEEFIQEENAKESKEIDELTSYTHGKKIESR